MEAKQAAREAVEKARERLVDLSHRIHANPELAFEEELASTWVAEELERAGFSVRHGVYELPTAVEARYGSGPLHVTICAEYDALPEIGHACGHNVIAAMAVGAGIGLLDAVDDVGLTLTVLGTPGEEGGGGKILLLDRGAFADQHLAMMVHPAPLDLADPVILAVDQLEITYRGKPAHASAFPDRGINASDALTVAQVAIGLLRQHIGPHDRIHGIVTRGGDAPNVIPAHTAARYMVRARTPDELDELCQRVRACFEAGAVATGARLEVDTNDLRYLDMRHDLEVTGIYQRNAEALGRSFPDLGLLKQRVAASTDMGNVSHALPSIHPYIGLDTLPAVNHQPEFADHCATAEADAAVVEGAVAMAWTAIDVSLDDELRDRLVQEGGSP